MKKGVVISADGKPKPHDFVIRDDDGTEYFAHLGDIKANEELLYHDPNKTSLEIGDKVEFDFPKAVGPRAIRIKKV